MPPIFRPSFSRALMRSWIQGSGSANCARTPERQPTQPILMVLPLARATLTSGTFIADARPVAPAAFKSVRRLSRPDAVLFFVSVMSLSLHNQ
ncbi:hypothetical protein [Bradyrhizobium sp. BR 1433]|uniref:hypothetical protein n=1 Tax=Bradyrhizobium sp. BR 1433 TaxID=3447967 RepID=UPI003EE5F972